MVNCKSDEDNDDIEEAVQMISKMTKMTMITDNQEFVDDTKKDDRKLKIVSRMTIILMVRRRICPD